ncbi:PepSY domain-containing protein [Streptomyces griseoaurantiacus]|uniref:Peptidase propeptide and YPEB domain-containing protein n=1 Tax=Streptomyces griseoaurantiacus TaxID=68213 RepID=A0A1G7G389_9ACTN|nr:PepSY domain-containing protein [Streptomyces jietaisiensis]SDE82489.1 Peptidase propeptide and YPEB domain-containing protein [Streptomyces jietaisiensis]
MKRNIVLAVVAAAVLAGGGTATALAVADDDGPGADDRVASAGRSGQDRADDAADDRDDRDDYDDDRGDGRHHDRHHDGRYDDGRDGRDGRDDDGREDDSAAASSAKVTAAEAIAAALRHTPGSVVSAELDDAVWSVEVLSSDDSWRDVRVDPGTGEVRGVRAEHEDAEDLAEARAALKGASTSAEEAARAAAAKGTVTSVELDERGWEAETLTSGGGERDWTVGLRGAGVTAGHP